MILDIYKHQKALHFESSATKPLKVKYMQCSGSVAMFVRYLHFYHFGIFKLFLHGLCSRSTCRECIHPSLLEKKSYDRNLAIKSIHGQF